MGFKVKTSDAVITTKISFKKHNDFVAVDGLSCGLVHEIIDVWSGHKPGVHFEFLNSELIVLFSFDDGVNSLNYATNPA